jgi:hypothetical protein
MPFMTLMPEVIHDALVELIGFWRGKKMKERLPGRDQINPEWWEVS